jgi:hypothetical protein
MKKPDNLTNMRFGKLTAIILSEMGRNGHAKWEVRCDCGNTKILYATHLKRGNTKSCGCDRRKPRNFLGVGDMPKTYYSEIKRSANGGKGRKAIEFRISMDYIWELYLSQNGLCKYSKLPIDFKTKTASLDRIDSSLGYTEDNVQWLHKDINMMKRAYTEEYFIKLCKLVNRYGATCEI